MGTCNETERSAQITVHIALATQPCQILSKPDGFDEGAAICRNEMNRTLALGGRKEGEVMRKIDYAQIVASVREMCLQANAMLLPMWRRPAAPKPEKLRL